MPGPGSPSLIDMMGDVGGGAPIKSAGGASFVSQFPNYTFPMWEAQPPLYSGGGISGPGGGGQGGVFSPPDDLKQYFQGEGNASTPRLDDPRKVAAESGISLADLVRGTIPRGNFYDLPSDRGGFFSLDDVYNTTRRDTPVSGPGQASGAPTTASLRTVGIPSIATYNSQMPSTNNWRLLGHGPGWIMRNGFLIDTQDASVPQGLWYGGTASGGNSAEQATGGGLGRVAFGTGAQGGLPNMFQTGLGYPTAFGWPGATSWVSFGPPADHGLM